jgi:micrococcal nuclease
MNAMLPRRVLIAIVLQLPGLVPVAEAQPSCFPPVEERRVKIVRVERNGVLVFQDGRAAKLEGILLPAGSSDHAPDFIAQQAIAKLSELATAHMMAFAAVAPKEDRYDRLRAQAWLSDDTGERWLQRALLEQGLARVSIAPDRNECATELYAAERHARAARIGIWSVAAYRMRTPDQLGDASGTFQIVEGTVRSVSKNGGRVFLEFGRDPHNDFAVVITSDDMKIFRSIGVDPFSYQNQTIRVRGWIGASRHSEMEVATPDDIEVIETPELRGSIAAPE